VVHVGVDQQHPQTALGSSQRTHHASGTCPQNHQIKVIHADTQNEVQAIATSLRPCQ
jgi:hypothetical protein